MITLLAGGTGAAKLVDGLIQETDPADLTLVCNTGDDVQLFGLHISPDVDTNLYTLAGIIDWEKGWGISGDSFFCMDSLGKLGYEIWFRLGDRDLATHLSRSLELRGGRTLSETIESLCRALGLKTRLLPMSNDPVETRVVTAGGDRHFQEFFVKGAWQEEVCSVYFKGAEAAQPAPGVIAAILEAQAVILCPSNPVTSLGPILAVPGIRKALSDTQAPVLAVSAIVGGQPVSGPAHKLMAARGWEVSALGVARALKDVADFLVIDSIDRDQASAISALGLEVLVTETVMRNRDDRRRLARGILENLGVERQQ
ncbi:MAG TPA: 2-phospho-L-lactate transferase [bacterium]|nr:2-phospho-L-lactate transferase [bacterium]